jgi:hypothetical protein
MSSSRSSLVGGQPLHGVLVAALGRCWVVESISACTMMRSAAGAY